MDANPPLTATLRIAGVRRSGIHQIAGYSCFRPPMAELFARKAMAAIYRPRFVTIFCNVAIAALQYACNEAARVWVILVTFYNVLQSRRNVFVSPKSEIATSIAASIDAREKSSSASIDAREKSSSDAPSLPFSIRRRSARLKGRLHTRWI